VEENDGQFLAHPIAGDRDNAFFKLEGVIPKMISNDLLLPELQTFEHDIEYMPGLVRSFDVYFLRMATMDDFLKEAKHLQDTLTDKTIDTAFALWSKNIYDLNAEEIKTKLKARRARIVEYAKSFKSILDERELEPVILKGSEDLQLDENLSKCFDCAE